MKNRFTGVILAGGKNSRLPGKKKAFHTIGRQTIIEKIQDTFALLFDETIIVANDLGEFTCRDAMIVTDISPARCALAGIHAGIYYAGTDAVFVCACDTPFLKEEVVAYILSQADPAFDVTVPETDGGLEALAAVYSKRCLPLIETNLKKGICMIKKFYIKNRVKKIPAHALKKIDPDMQSFFNINTPEDLEQAHKMAMTAKIRN